MNVTISENLFYDIISLLTEPKLLNPSENECVVTMDRRDAILGHLLQIQRQHLFEGQSKDQGLWK